MAVRLSALCADHPLPPRRFLVLIFVRSWVDLRVILWLEGLGQLRNPVTSKIKPHDLPACSIVPQPTTLLCAPFKNIDIHYLLGQIYWSQKYEVLLKSSRTRSKKKCWLNLLNFGCHLLQRRLLGNVYSNSVFFHASKAPWK
jgi:hypothetical protein